MSRNRPIFYSRRFFNRAPLFVYWWLIISQESRLRFISSLKNLNLTNSAFQENMKPRVFSLRLDRLINKPRLSLWLCEFNWGLFLETRAISSSSTFPQVSTKECIKTNQYPKISLQHWKQSHTTMSYRLKRKIHHLFNLPSLPLAPSSGSVQAIRVVGFNGDGGVSRGHEGGTCSYFDGHLSICLTLPGSRHRGSPKKGKKKSATIPFVHLQIAKLRVL